jgi:hypothetical protein
MSILGGFTKERTIEAQSHIDDGSEKVHVNFYSHLSFSLVQVRHKALLLPKHQYFVFALSTQWITIVTSLICRISAATH